MNFSLSGGGQEPSKDDKKKSKDKPSKNIEKQKKDWFDWWLSDDPPAPAAKEELRAARVKQANTYTPRNAKAETTADGDIIKPAPTNVTININLSKLKVPKIVKPKVKPPKVKLPALPYKRIVIIVISLVAVGIPANLAYQHHKKQVQAAKLEAARQALAAQPARTAPSFTPAVPKNNTDLGKISPDNKKTAYDGNRDTFSFIDTLDATNLTVSEQLLPAGSGTAQQTVAKVANQISAKTPIILSGNNVAYLHSEDKSGAQTVVFSINGLLVFINSAFHHDASAYKLYIENLQ